MPNNVIAGARKAGIPVTICESLDEVLEDTDVLYVTRIQKERFSSELEWQQVKDAYRVDHAVLSRAKEDMIVMHPLPRVNGKLDLFISVLKLIPVLAAEIDPEVDFDSRRAVYFRQMRYGLFVRYIRLCNVSHLTRDTDPHGSLSKCHGVKTHFKKDRLPVSPQKNYASHRFLLLNVVATPICRRRCCCRLPCFLSTSWHIVER